MDIGAIIIIMIIAVILVLTFYIIGLYNGLIDARNKVEDQFTQIHLELKKKSDIIPNIIEVLNKYIKHEEKILNELITSKNKLDKANKINEIIKSSNNINIALSKIVSLSETYPELKKNKIYLSLIKQLEEIEDRINYARTFYNEAVLKYNNMKDQFPSNIVAKVFKFKIIDYYK